MRNLRQGTAIAGQVRTLLDDGAAGGLTDAELLERFATRGGDAAGAAFAALVERHGPMVLRACRSILRDPHDSQDAFQATFLLLARRAGSLWVRDSLAPWLHSVACRVSSGARAAEGRRRALERRAAGRASRSAGESPRDDLGPALQEEIERLPERLKAPVVLCYLEGLTHDQAADHLACPVGTVRSRLARGRERLRRALIRRGLAPPSSTDRGSPTPLTVPPSLAILTIQAARLASDRSTIGLAARWLILLSEGVLKPMMIHPLKTAAVLLLASGAIAAGLGATSGQEPKPPENPAPAASPRDRSADEKRFEAIERRLRDLELKLEELTPPRRTSVRSYPADPNIVVKIRPRVANTVAQEVFVAPGSVVKKGDPLLIISCPELAQAKADLLGAFLKWDRNRKFLKFREPLAKDGRITQLVWTDTVDDEKQSRLVYEVARAQLAPYGMSNEEIDKLVEGRTDDTKAGEIGEARQMRELSKLTVVSPIDGVVVGRDVAVGNTYDQTNVLLIIAPSKP